MATKAENLRVAGIKRGLSTRRRPSIARAVGDWGRRGQLGASSVTEMGRHTGARV